MTTKQRSRIPPQALDGLILEPLSAAQGSRWLEGCKREDEKSMTKLEMVQQAMAVKGEATSEEIAAFIEQWHGVKIEAKFIPVYKATLKDKQLLEEKRRAAQALVAQAVAEATPEAKPA